LAAAGYAGPWDIDSTLAAYQRAAGGPEASTTDVRSAPTAACGQNADRVLLSWQYDPYNPDRATSNATRELGVPAFGPSADFYFRSALRELYRAVATPGGMDPMNIRSRMLAGLKGATSQSSASQRVQYLVEHERKISAVNGQLRALGNDEQVRQIVDPTCPIFDSDIALIVYLVSVIESDANAAARLYFAQIYGPSTSVWLTTADFLGRSLATRQASGDQLRDGWGSLEFLSKMVAPLVHPGDPLNRPPCLPYTPNVPFCPRPTGAANP